MVPPYRGAVVEALRPSLLGSFIPWRLKNQNHIAFVVWRFDRASTITSTGRRLPAALPWSRTAPSSQDASTSPPEAL